MASANIVSRHLGRKFDRSPKEDREGFTVFTGDHEGTVFVDLTIGSPNWHLPGDEQRARIATMAEQYTEHLSARWEVQRHPKLHNVLVISDRIAPPVDEADSILASRPEGPSYDALPDEGGRARIVPARDVTEGDIVVAGVDNFGDGTGWHVDWFGEPYEADPSEFEPTHDCGACEDVAPGLPMVVLTSEAPHGPMITCDVWPADRLVLIVSPTATGGRP